MENEKNPKELIAENIRKIREARNLTQSELAEKAGVNKSTVSMYESASRTPKLDFAKKLAKALDVSVDSFYSANSTLKFKHLDDYDYSVQLPKGFIHVPMMGYAAAGKPLEDLNQDTAYYDVDGKYHVDFCITVSGDSMINAGINDGDIVFIREMPAVPNGTIALVRIDNDKFCLKRFYKGENKVTLVSENPAYPPMVFDESNCESVSVLGLAVIKQSVIK